MVDIDEMVYDRLCHNNQDGDEQVFYTYGQGSSGVKSREVFKFSNILFGLYYFLVKMFFKRRA